MSWRGGNSQGINLSLAGLSLSIGPCGPQEGEGEVADRGQVHRPQMFERVDAPILDASLHNQALTEDWSNALTDQLLKNVITSAVQGVILDGTEAEVPTDGPKM